MPMLKRALPAKVELIDCSDDESVPRKVMQVSINGTPVMVPLDQLPEITAFDTLFTSGDGTAIPDATLFTVTLYVSELTIRAARDEDFRV